MMNQIHQGDCLEVMKLISTGSVDMILCDLPYGTTKNQWDVIIPFDLLWESYHRIIKPGGAIVLFGKGFFTADLMNSNRKEWRYNLIWHKDRPSGHLNAKRQPMSDHEDICVFYDSQPTYNPQMWEGKPLHSVGTKCLTENVRQTNYGKYDRIATTTGETRKYPRSVQYFPRPHPPLHPTQKPTELLEYLIRTYTNPLDVVLDNCIGSGSTAVAALNTGRYFIGIEQELKYVEIAHNRLPGFLR